ncbi:MAG: hypothetical protein K6E36_01585 [Oscillospiraceae bacterium]|nr:hypothetical protein [Oscillospiraceae bacterium]MCR5305181.1 hypothetical protein [Oscillospiraceae bacterium]
MKKITAILFSTVVSFSMCSCANNNSASNNGGTQEDHEQCASKYALTSAEYRYVPQYKENEVYLLHGKLKLDETRELEEEGIKFGFVYYGVGDERYYPEEESEQHGKYLLFGVYGAGISESELQELGIKQGEEIYLLYKNLADTSSGDKRDWTFYQKKDLDFLSKYVSSLESEETPYESNVNGCEFVSSVGYLYLSAEEADAAYEKMISEGGISTEKYKKGS